MPRTPNSTTLFQNLLPGKYKVTSYSLVYDAMRGANETTEEIVAAEFEVKAGERKDLGTIVIEPSKNVVPSTVSRRGGSAQPNDAPTDEDQDPGFEP